MSLIDMRQITRSYQVGDGELTVLKDITLTVEEGEFVAIMGASGSGKSTLMQIMGLLDRPSSGSYRLLEQDVSRLSDNETAALRSRTIGFIFQMFNLLARTSAIDNVILPMIYTGQSDRETHARGLLKLVGLEDRMDHRPNELSGGQQQRVAIARALANRPRLIFADEPTGNLASEQANEVLARLADLNRHGTTVVMVTHEPEIAAFAKRVIHIKDGQMVGDERRTPSPSMGEGGSPRATRDGGDGRENAPPTSVLPHEGGGSSFTEPGFTFAELFEHVRSALRAMAANKARSALSILGILIGVASVITMLAIGRGAQKAIEARLQSLGSNVVMMFAGAPSMRGVRGAAGNYTRLTLDDVRAVRRLSNVADIYGEVEGNVRLVYGGQNSLTEIQGVPPSYESIRNAAPYAGRFFSEKENISLARVILLGQTPVRELFGSADPLGKIIEVNHNAFRVIGVLPMKGASGMSDQDDLAVIPIYTGMKRVFGNPYLHEMAIQCASAEAIPDMMADIQRLMRKRHRLSIFKEDDFTLRNNAELQSTLSDTIRTFGLLLGIVAAISLLVGGVGVMNIMLVSVNERTREIGLRKAIGATRRAILIQFLLESVLLSVIGGLIGVGLSLVLAAVLTFFAGWTAIVLPHYILLAFGFSAGVGVIFGFWPAYKASLLSPIEALRYE